MGRMAEGGIRLGGAPSLWVSGRPEWVAVHFEGPGEEPILLGYSVPESLSSSITAWVKELPAKSPEDPAEWVLSLEEPSRALFGKRGPGEDEVTFTWQGTKDDNALREQM